MATNITHAPVPIEAVQPARRKWNRRIIVVAVLVIAITTGATAVLVLRDSPVEQTVVDRDAIAERLVNQGLIPRAALEPTVVDRDALAERLVNQGLIPRAALDPAAPTREELTRDLVNRGLIPEKALTTGE
jgi:hypothetical protein